MSDVSEAKVTVNIRILDNEFQVSCAENEVDDLKASAQDLDRRMREIRDAGGTVGLERIAVLAALNLSHDHLRLGRRQEEDGRLAGRRVRALAERIGKAVANADAKDAPSTAKVGAPAEATHRAVDGPHPGEPALG